MKFNVFIVGLLLSINAVNASEKDRQVRVKESLYELTARVQRETQGSQKGEIGTAQHAGYRTVEAWWCPVDGSVRGAVAREYDAYCTSKGGKREIIYAGTGLRFACRATKNADIVLFLIDLDNTQKCRDVPTRHVTVVEPVGRTDEPRYLAALKERGFRTTLELRAKEAATRAAEYETAEKPKRELLQKQRIGTTLCQKSVEGRILAVGNVEQFAAPKLQIRVVSYASGTRHESIVWDLPENWFLCN